MKSLNSKFYILNPVRGGFTIVELLISVAIFAIVISIASGGFIRALRSQRAAAALMEANDNAAQAIEQMAREIRTGYNFSTRAQPRPLPLPISGCTPTLSDQELQFVNSKNLVTRYRLVNEGIERASKDETTACITEADYKKITADSVRITAFNILLFGYLPTDGFPPRITISLSVGARGQYLDFVLTDIQTTISARVPDEGP